MLNPSAVANLLGSIVAPGRAEVVVQTALLTLPLSAELYAYADVHREVAVPLTSSSLMDHAPGAPPEERARHISAVVVEAWRKEFGSRKAQTAPARSERREEHKVSGISPARNVSGPHTRDEQGLLLIETKYGRICIVSIRVPSLAKPERRTRRQAAALLNSRSPRTSLSTGSVSTSTDAPNTSVVGLRSISSEHGADVASFSTEDELPSGQDTDDRESIVSSDVPRTDTLYSEPIMLLSLVAAPTQSPFESDTTTTWHKLYAQARAFAELVGCNTCDATAEGRA